MKKIAKLFASVALSLTLPAMAQAATIDFSGANGAAHPSPLVLPEATISSSGGFVSVGFFLPANSFCFSDASSCAFDGAIAFSDAVDNLLFDVGSFGSGDSVTIGIFSGATHLGDVSVTGNGQLDLSAFDDVTRLDFDDSSTASGVRYSTFMFDWADIRTDVPEPGSLTLLGAALAGLGFARRRKAA